MTGAELAPMSTRPVNGCSPWATFDGNEYQLDPLEPMWPSEDFYLREPSPDSALASCALSTCPFLDLPLGFDIMEDIPTPWTTMQAVAQAEVPSTSCDLQLQSRLSDSSCLSETLVLQLGPESTSAAATQLFTSPGGAQSSSAAPLLPEPGWAAKQRAALCPVKGEQLTTVASSELPPWAFQHAQDAGMPDVDCKPKERAAAPRGKPLPKGGKRQQLQLAPLGSRRAGGPEERARIVQRKYLERKKKRDHALHERVEELRARRAALERAIAPALARYDVLTSRLPLCQLQDEAELLASIAAGVPDMLLALKARAGGVHNGAPGHLTSLLEQAAALDSCCSAAALLGAPAGLDALELRSSVALQGIGKRQRKALAERSAATLAEVAELRAQAGSLIRRLQALGTCAGRQRPSLAWLQRAVAGHLTCAQLRGVAQREGRLTERLLRGCRMAAHSTEEKASFAATVNYTDVDAYALCQEMVNA